MTFGTLALFALIKFAYISFALSIAAVISCLVGYLSELLLKVRHTDNRNWLVVGNAFVGCSIPAVTLIHWFVDGKNPDATNFDVAVTIVASAVLAPAIAALVFSLKTLLCRAFAFADALFMADRSK
jgi:hypothetical protein